MVVGVPLTAKKVSGKWFIREVAACLIGAFSKTGRSPKMSIAVAVAQRWCVSLQLVLISGIALPDS
jgi:hypothetical protein